MCPASCYQRVTQIRRYAGNEDPCQRVDFSYDTNPYEPSYTQNGWGRLALARWGGAGCAGGEWREMYNYTAAGKAVKKKLVNAPKGITGLEAVWTYL